MDTPLFSDALAITSHWRDDLDLERLTAEKLRSREVGVAGGTVDVVALGKAASEMTEAARAVLGGSIAREFVISDRIERSPSRRNREFIVGEHPTPGAGSRRAGEALERFFEEETSATDTLFLISGGASSLCVVPEAPFTLGDARRLFAAALAAGVDITTLNKVRASVSSIAGGAVLRRVRTSRSTSLILVDNVVSGAPWVASALTYDYASDVAELTTLLAACGLLGSDVGDRILEASRVHAARLAHSPTTRHENVVLGEPALLLESAIAGARRLGYEVLTMGSAVQGDVTRVAREWGALVRERASSGVSGAMVGVGEVSVAVRGRGRGGRCQEFAWRLAREIDGLGREVVVMAIASDGRDFLEGVGGAWADTATLARARERGITWEAVAAANDTNGALATLGLLLEGASTGWNLCDLYLVVW